MKQFLFFTFFISFCVLGSYAQNDTLYIMKDGGIVARYNVKTQIDSIVFHLPAVVPGEPEEPEEPEEVEGENLVANPSFEDDPVVWLLKDANSSIVSDVAHTGSASLKIISDGKAANHVVDQLSFSGIIPGEEYTFSVWVKGENLAGDPATNGRQMAVLRWRNAANQIIPAGQEMDMFAPSGTYDWMKLSTNMQAPEDAVGADVVFRVWSGCLSGEGYWDDVMLYKREFSLRGDLAETYDVNDYTNLAGGGIEKTDMFYSGEGYLVVDENGAFVEWNNVDGGSGGKYIISIRYSFIEEEQDWQLKVNDETYTIKPRATGAKFSWATHDREVNLKSGNNTVRITLNKVNSGNNNQRIDRIDIYKKN